MPFCCTVRIGSWYYVCDKDLLNFIGQCSLVEITPRWIKKKKHVLAPIKILSDAHLQNLCYEELNRISKDRLQYTVEHFAPLSIHWRGSPLVKEVGFFFGDLQISLDPNTLKLPRGLTFKLIVWITILPVHCWDCIRKFILKVTSAGGGGCPWDQSWY
jgi:hypothetical protein